MRQANSTKLVDRAVALRKLLEREATVPQHLSRDCSSGVDLHLHAGHFKGDQCLCLIRYLIGLSPCLPIRGVAHASHVDDLLSALG